MYRRFACSLCFGACSLYYVFACWSWIVLFYSFRYSYLLPLNWYTCITFSLLFLTTSGLLILTAYLSFLLLLTAVLSVFILFTFSLFSSFFCSVSHLVRCCVLFSNYILAPWYAPVSFFLRSYFSTSLIFFSYTLLLHFSFPSSAILPPTASLISS